MRKTFLHIVMPSHYNCCIPLCTNHSIKIRNLSFYRIPKDESLRKKYTRLIRKTLKLESSHTRICSAHFEEVRRNIPGVNPVKKGNYLEGGGLVNDVLSETDLAVGAEFEFEAVEAGLVKDITDCRVRDTYRQWKLTTFSPLNLTVTGAKKLKEIQVGTNVKSRN